LQGKELSYNNLSDLDAALWLAFDFDEPCAVVVKHTNPCGVAVHADVATAFRLALSADPVSAYGGILAFNRPIDAALATTILESRTFFEVIAAPGVDEAARTCLAGRVNLRVLELPADWSRRTPGGHHARRVQGGWLVQDWDDAADGAWSSAARAPTPAETALLRFAWSVCRRVSSNAIVLATESEGGRVLNGVGAGQTSRVDAVRIALARAVRPVEANVLASDAFFPFPDGVERALEAGVRAFVQPGGSVRDDAVLAVVRGAGAVMELTGRRHFRH
jgi:phosphoribosylaminoimidazolecarboxamide formyltransferase/IMP cyclohydrolase